MLCGNQRIRGQTRRLAALLALAVSATGHADTPPATHAALMSVFYDFEVASYCGLITDSVGSGFRREVDRLLVTDRLEQGALDELRGKAWQAAHAEWQNRGLGGYRRWCATEGEAAARRFSSNGGRTSEGTAAD